MKIETLAVHAGRAVEAGAGDVAPAIHLSTTFERGADGNFSRGYSYARADNPSRGALEKCIAQLEGGIDAIAFSSGSAASFAVFSLLRSGERVIAPHECYHGTGKQLRDLAAAGNLRAAFVDTTEHGMVRTQLELDAQLLWLETPSNPTLNISDIQVLCELAHAARAIVCCDNTFATPVLQRPFTLGADLVIHSTTKYFGGHSDVMGGVVVVRDSTELAAKIRDYQATAGAVPSPFDCWLARRSIATLPYRMRAQTATAQRVAEFLADHPQVERVFYPGLAAHPGHELARRQMPGGFGAMVSFCVKGSAQDALRVAGRTRLLVRATSLGGVESLIEHRASVEGPHTRTPQNLLRMSIGLEHADDLIADLRQALESNHA